MESLENDLLECRHADHKLKSRYDSEIFVSVFFSNLRCRRTDICTGFVPHFESRYRGQFCQLVIESDFDEFLQHEVALTIFFDDFLSHFGFYPLEFNIRKALPEGFNHVPPGIYHNHAHTSQSGDFWLLCQCWLGDSAPYQAQTGFS